MRGRSLVELLYGEDSAKYASVNRKAIYNHALELGNLQYSDHLACVTGRYLVVNINSVTCN